MTSAFKALIFDLDGTLVDSATIVRKVMESWCLKHNIPLQPVMDVCQGGRTEDTVSLVAPHLCAETEAVEIELMERTALENLSPIAGANRFLDSVESFLWAMVTSSSMVVAKSKLAACRLPHPPVLITAESVTSGKPHPEPFLKAATELKIEPADCLVFEDADNGVNSALSAGCKVIVIGDSCSIEHPNIICRLSDFRNLSLSQEGHLKPANNLIATLRKNQTGSPCETPAPARDSSSRDETLLLQPRRPSRLYRDRTALRGVRALRSLRLPSPVVA